MRTMRRLPPFPALVAFEAVARLGGFTRAAAELHLTQSAVSHRIRALEAHAPALEPVYRDARKAGRTPRCGP